MRQVYHVIVPVLLLAAGCSLFSDTDNYRAERTGYRSWPVGGISAFEVSTGNGYIIVDAIRSDSIRADFVSHCTGKDKADAERYLGYMDVRENIGGGRIAITADILSGSSRDNGVRFDVELLEAVHVKLRTSNAPVKVIGSRGGGDLHTSNAPVTIESTEGPFAVHTSNGVFTARGHVGSIQAQTSNGGISCDIARLDAPNIADLNATDGDVVLTLPSDVSASFNLETSNGTITVTGFPGLDFESRDELHKYGTIGAGDASIRVYTTNGDIQLRAR